MAKKTLARTKPEIKEYIEYINELSRLPNLKPGEYRDGIYRDSDMLVIVTKDAGRWHISISSDSKIPNYAKLKWARYAFVPDSVYMAQVFPPKSQFVNVHEYTLHLWQVEDPFLVKLL